MFFRTAPRYDGGVDGSGDSEADLAAARIAEAAEAAFALARDSADQETAWKRATRFTEQLQALTTTGGELRAAIAAAIAASGNLSLARLGDRIGVSKARAQQMIEAARRKGKQ
jgi:hypothetical protein